MSTSMSLVANMLGPRIGSIPLHAEADPIARRSKSPPHAEARLYRTSKQDPAARRSKTLSHVEARLCRTPHQDPVAYVCVYFNVGAASKGTPLGTPEGPIQR
eukprot:1714941-Amphidinium_carterae.3